MKPYITEDASQKLQDIIDATEKQFNNEVKITPGEAKRIELIRKMKDDTDKTEYMVMLKALVVIVLIVAMVHFYFYRDIFAFIAVVVILGLFVFIRQRLKLLTNQLMEYKNNFDKYLWEGFHLKEMRYTAVKLAYFIGFPLLLVMLSDVFSNSDEKLGWFVSWIIALIISSLGWMIYFKDDQDSLNSLESELKSLDYL